MEGGGVRGVLGRGVLPWGVKSITGEGGDVDGSGTGLGLRVKGETLSPFLPPHEWQRTSIFFPLAVNLS